MELSDVMRQMMQQSMDGYGLSDMAIGTVTGVKPLAVRIREGMADIPQEALRLTAAVIEKKIPVLEHLHTTDGFRHAHALPDGLQQDAFDSDKRLLKHEIVCYEDGKALPVKDGYIILNRALETGDKVLLLRVMRGQQFIILSRVFEKEA